MLMFTVITVQLYHTPIALLEQLYPVGLFYFSRVVWGLSYLLVRNLIIMTR